MKLTNHHLIILIVLMIPVLTIFSCQRMAFDSSQYWQRELPGIIADTSKQFYVDTLIKNESTALAIAEPILASKYGQSHIDGDKPLKAIKVDNFWIIDGTLPRNTYGGTATVILRATDGKVMLLTHYK